MQRRYTLTEIDQMRRAVETKWLFGLWPHEMTGSQYTGRTYCESEKAAGVEEMLRTYMAAGMGPEDMGFSSATPAV